MAAWINRGLAVGLGRMNRRLAVSGRVDWRLTPAGGRRSQV
jgi:hypothetical protein